MKKMVLLLVVATICVAHVPAGAEELYAERVTGGTLDLEWFTPYEEVGGNVPVALTLSGGEACYPNPSGDTHVVSLSTIPMGPYQLGGSLATDAVVSDGRLDAWIFTGSGEARVGILFRNSVGASYGYQFVIDSGLFQVKFRRGDGGMSPETIAFWMGGDIPGGPPPANTWHKLSIEGVGDQINLWMDDMLMPGCPFTDDTYDSGYFGTYVFCTVPFDLIADDIIMSEVTSPVEEMTWGAIKAMYAE